MVVYDLGLHCFRTSQKDIYSAVGIIIFTLFFFFTHLYKVNLTIEAMS